MNQSRRGAETCCAPDAADGFAGGGWRLNWRPATARSCCTAWACRLPSSPCRAAAPRSPSWSAACCACGRNRSGEIGIEAADAGDQGRPDRRRFHRAKPCPGAPLGGDGVSRRPRGRAGNAGGSDQGCGGGRRRGVAVPALDRRPAPVGRRSGCRAGGHRQPQRPAQGHGPGRHRRRTTSRYRAGCSAT